MFTNKVRKREMKIYSRFLVSVSCIVVWFVVDEELMDWMCVVIAVALAFSCFYEAIKNRKRVAPMLIGALLNLSFVSFAIYAHDVLVKEVDQYAHDMINNYPCQASFLQAISSDNSWRGQGFKMRTFNYYGATRRISYQDNGLLRYGFPYDSRHVWLADCVLLWEPSPKNTAPNAPNPPSHTR